MSTALYAFNVSKQSYISLGVTVANSFFARLRGLLGKIQMRSDEALWIRPSRGIHTMGLPFAIDVVYLDANLRVVHVIENLGPTRIGPFRLNSDSVLELPARSVYDSGTEVGDQLMICSPEAMDAYWEEQRSRSACRPEPSPR